MTDPVDQLAKGLSAPHAQEPEQRNPALSGQGEGFAQEGSGEPAPFRRRRSGSGVIRSIVTKLAESSARLLTTPSTAQRVSAGSTHLSSDMRSRDWCRSTARSWTALGRPAASASQEQEDGGSAVDRDGDGEAHLEFGNPDFDIRQLRSNLVLRWEYMPGSRVVLVWSQDPCGLAPDGRFRLGRDLDELFGADGRHVVLVKLKH